MGEKGIASARKVFCPHCGALYEATVPGQSVEDRTAAQCVVCREPMEPGTGLPAAYKLIQRPETSAD